MTPSRIYGLIGYPVKHSFSPAMHNVAFKYLGINAEYRLFEVKPEELEVFLLKPDAVFKDTNGNSIRAGDVLGFNITIPHKVRAKEILDTNFPSIISAPDIKRYIQLSGAINTVRKESGKVPYSYHNTDAAGFLQSLKDDLEFDTKDKNVFLIGCGGAGRAVFASLARKGIKEIRKIYIFEIDTNVVAYASQYFSQIDYLKGRWEFISSEQIPEVVKKCQLLVNASPIGMKEGDVSAVDKGLLPNEGLSVYDLVYNRETQLIKDAKSKGLNAKAGEGMLLWQGILAFEFWTGKHAPIDIMRQALQEELQKSRDVS